MSFSEHTTLPIMNNDYWVQNSISNGDMDSKPYNDHSPSIKKPRILMNENFSPSNSPSLPRMNPLNTPVNRGTGYIFYKTRMCLKFLDNNCRNGDKCTFAHGAADLREPPPNWQEIVGRKENSYDDQRTMPRFKICKRYANGEECSYGENCNFLHKRPTTCFDDDEDGPRESSAIRIGTNGPVMGIRNVSDQIDATNNMNNSQNKHVTPGLDVFRGNVKPTYWKTKICSKWEISGECPFGDRCHFAHGQAVLQLPSFQNDADAVHVFSSIPPATMPVFSQTTATTEVNTAVIAPTTDNGIKKCYQKWKGPKNINNIYGDWIEDLTPPLMFPKNFESRG